MTQLTCAQLRGRTAGPLPPLSLLVHSNPLGELEKQLDALQVELHDLRIRQKPQQAAEVRKSIGQVRLVQNQSIKENLRLLYGDRPRDLRAKQTRAMRRQLTSTEASSSLKKIHRRKCAFPSRTFAVKEE